MVAELPAGDAYDSVLALVGDGLTRGLSVEFHALRTNGGPGTLRTIMHAALPGLGIVDRPAYTGSGVELRVNGRGIGGRLDYGRDRVTADRGKRRKERFAPECRLMTLWTIYRGKSLSRSGTMRGKYWALGAPGLLRSRTPRRVLSLTCRNCRQRPTRKTSRRYWRPGPSRPGVGRFL